MTFGIALVELLIVASLILLWIVLPNLNGGIFFLMRTTICVLVMDETTFLEVCEVALYILFKVAYTMLINEVLIIIFWVVYCTSIVKYEDRNYILDDI